MENFRYVSEQKEYSLSHTFTPENVPKQFSRHIHNFYEIILIVQGAGVYGTEDYSLSVSPYDLVVTPAFTYHFLEMKNDAVYERFTLYTKQKELNGLLEKALGDVQGVLNIGENKLLKNYFTKIDYCFQNKHTFERGAYDILMRHNIEELIFYLSAYSASDFSQKNLCSDYPPVLSEMIRYIAAHLAAVSVESLAQKFHISPTYVCVLFRKYLMISPRDYIISKRLAYALQLMEEGEGMQNAAYACGYQNYSSFYRAYVKQYGVSPSANRSPEAGEKQKP